VRVRGGVLDGIEGVLVSNQERRLVISIDTVRHSLSVSLEGFEVETI
jgi:hypothetical protein